jgi:hypothetical protein
MNCHITWIQASNYIEGKKLIPKGIKNNYNIIKKLNNNINIKTWDNNDILNLIKTDYKEYLELYNNIKDFRFISDLGRLLILYKFGGIYIDIDQKCYKSFKDFGINENTKLVVCRSVETDRVCNGFIYVKEPKNSFIKECITEYVNMLKNNLNTSGCVAMNNVLNINIDNLDFVLLKERNIKKREECNCETTYNLNFYFFNNSDQKIMKSRYADYYRDKELKDVKYLVDFE